MAEAPFCNVDVALPPGKPGARDRLQLVPENATIKQFIRIFNRNIQNIQINNYGQRPPTPGGGQTGFTTKPGQEDWKELTRTTAKVRVTNPNDSSQFVDVEQITGLTMKSKKTGETWVWKR